MDDLKKLELLADTFECDVEDLAPEKTLDELGVMNSMSALSLIVMMEDECDKTLTREQLNSFVTIGDIMAYMG